MPFRRAARQTAWRARWPRTPPPCWASRCAWTTCPARAAPDGYTLVQLPVSVFLPPSSDGKSHAAAGDALVPVIQVSGYALGLSLSPDSPLMSWERLAGWAKGYLAGLTDGSGAAAASATPTRKALGLGLIQNEPFGIGAPRGTPPEVVQRLQDAFAQAMAQDNFRMG